MNDRTAGKPIPDDKLASLLNVLVNVWWQKWKRLKLNDDLFMQAWSELDQIMNQGQAYPVVKHLCITFLYELSARMNGGYTATEANKLITLIRSEGE